MLAVLLAGSGIIHAQGTSFTYQGQLTANGAPATGNFGMIFNLCQSPIPGNGQIGTVQLPTVPVSNGLFTVSLDFGAAAFTGTNLWLEVDVETNGGYAVLFPRQPLTATPYAITANAADNLVGLLPAGQLSGTLPASLFSGGYGSAVTLSNSANSFVGTFTGNGAGLTNLNLGSLSSTGTNVFNGRVGIGTSTPASALDVVVAANADGIRLTGSSAAPYSTAYFLFDGSIEEAAFGLSEQSGGFSTSANNPPISGQEDVVIRADTGNLILQHGGGVAGLMVNVDNTVGVGFQGYSDQALAVNGNFYVLGTAYSTGGFMLASDARFKTNVVTLEAALDTVLRLRGVSYDWKRAEYSDKNFPATRQLGFIAQEVQKVLPQLVQKGEGDSLTLNYLGMIPVLVEAVKDQQAEINVKDERISALETRLADLEKTVNRLAEKDPAANR